MADRLCPRGWILCPSETDGEYVPFFVYVRDKDIIWDENNLPSLLREIAKIGSNTTLHYPMYQWTFLLDEWKVTLYQDGSYNAIKKLSIHENSEYKSQTEIDVTFNLPFKTDNDNDFNIQLTKSGTTQDIITSSINIIPITDNVISCMVTQLINNHYYFASNFSTNTSYKDQYLYIEIRGNIHFE